MLTPRYYQQESIDGFFDYIDEHDDNPLIVLPTGCVSWDTIINENRCSLGRKKRIDKMYLAYNGLCKNRKWNYDKNKETYVRSLIMKTDTIQLNKIDGIMYSGVKDLLILTLENKNFIKATPDHKIMTKRGWVEMKSLSVNDEVMCDTLKPKKTVSKYKKLNSTFACNLWYHPYAKTIKTKKEKRGYTKRIENYRAIYECHINNISIEEYRYILRNDEIKSNNLKYVDPKLYDIHHIDQNHKNNDPENLVKLTKSEHQKLHSKKFKHHFSQGLPIFSKVNSIEYYGKDHTYDISCVENHNFVANGIVVHNSGKSLVQANIIKRVYNHKGTRILLLTHQKDLILQNYDELFENIDDMLLDVGIYSAGLKRRDTHNRILFAGIQSVFKKAWDLGFFDLILIDECHLVNNDNMGMYRIFLNEQKRINPDIIVGGLTATHFRTKHGLLTEGKDRIFHGIAHSVSMVELMNPKNPLNVDNKQYLCPLTSPKKSMKNKVDLTNVHVRGGKYVDKELEDAFTQNHLVSKCVKEVLQYDQNRNKVLIFTAGIKHAEEVYAYLKTLVGDNVGLVHSQRSDMENDIDKAKFKEDKYKYLININSLTTGYNVKQIDCIVILRSMYSPGLYIQIGGRGCRLHPSKKDCLVLDFGRNIERFGPIDKIEIKSKRENKNGFEGAPQKCCPECDMMLHATVMECPECGYLFPEKDKHEDSASEKSIMSKWIKPKNYDIVRVQYSKHYKQNNPSAPPSLRVDYYYSIYEKFSQWVPLESEKGQYFAKKWLKDVTNETIKDVDHALSICETAFRKPNKILVNENGKFPEIIGRLFDSDIPNLKEEENNIDIDKALESIIF